MRVVVAFFIWMIGVPYVGICLILGLIFSFLMPNKSFDPVLKLLTKSMFRLFRIKVETEGLDKLPKDQPVIFMANHSSFFDITLVEGFIPGFIRGVIAFKATGLPLYGWLMDRLGNITINRGSMHGSMRSMNKAQDYVSGGNSLMIFPEGNRSTTGELLPFKRLPFYLTKQCGLPLVPVAISGMYAVNNKNSLMVTPGTIVIRFGDVISEMRIEEFSVNELRDYVRDDIARRLD
jgi:1-acyl-sn-glycerol-3-phosphate acyltransferase